MDRKTGQAPLVSGILDVDKPAGMTSHDVVQAVRRGSGQRRVGHAGTLDPMATGVLLLCLGQATRVSEYLMDSRKTYLATVHLGVTTDSYDATGQVVSQSDSSTISLEDAEAAAAHFIGEVAQVPPMYSAIKHEGTPLYKLARRGVELELEPRKIHIYAIRFVNWAPPEATLEITCSGGTYIRSLAHDLGQALGVGAHLSALARTASGSFDLEHAVPLQELLDAFASGGWHDYLVPMDVALATYPACQLDGETASQVKHGQQVELANQPVDAAPESLCRAYEAGRFIAILRFVPEAGRWQPTKVFAD